MKKFFQDFKAFINKGNVMDMAVGVIIGGAFGKIVSSLVNDVIMPLITAAVGANSFSELTWTITKDVTMHYGNFIQTIIDFLIIAICVFLMMKVMMSARSAGSGLTADLKKKFKRNKKGQADAVAEESVVADASPEVQAAVEVPVIEATPTVEELLVQIRDLMAAQAKADGKDSEKKAE